MCSSDLFGPSQVASTFPDGTEFGVPKFHKEINGKTIVVKADPGHGLVCNLSLSEPWGILKSVYFAMSWKLQPILFLVCDFCNSNSKLANTITGNWTEKDLTDHLKKVLHQFDEAGLNSGFQQIKDSKAGEKQYVLHAGYPRRRVWTLLGPSEGSASWNFSTLARPEFLYHTDVLTWGVRLRRQPAEEIEIGDIMWQLSFFVNDVTA